jgi:hypothetical protein
MAADAIETTELRVIANALGRMMATANAEDEPIVQMRDGTGMVADMALAGPVATFATGTPFGFDVRVTVSKATGMFNAT